MTEPSPGPDYLGLTQPPETLDVDVVFIPVFGRDDDLSDLRGLEVEAMSALGRARASGAFRDGVYELLPVTAGAPWKARAVILVGAGTLVEQDTARRRRVAAAAGLEARRFAAATFAFAVRGPGAGPAAAQAAADGLTSAEFDAGAYKSDQRPWRPSRVLVTVPGGDAGPVADAVRRGRVIGECATFTRELANEPPNVLPPREFARRLAERAAAAGLAVDVLDEARIEALGMRLLLGVARGSAEPPRLVVIRHEPPGAPADPVLALVGKGVTFDTGGLSLKPAEAMDRMKGDMSGGAAVAGAMLAIARLGGPFRVLAVIPMAENMPDGRATRPGDVIRGASGRTVEIINTDAEGRLILADALWYAGQLGATRVVDVATLTGACVVALGHAMAGLFGNDAAWIDVVKRAADRAGDRVWPMPIYEEATEQLRSEIADVVNSAGRPGGAVTAAAFLREFAGDRPWAHLDIAGVAWTEKKSACEVKGATGAAVRTLTELGMTGGRSDPA
jgi:leucyl aminopeptidase